MLLSLALAALPQPIDLDGLSLERARHLHGRFVVASFTIAKPLDTYPGLTSIGAADRDDGAERGAILRGRRFDVREGQRLNVVGAVFVPPWVELHVEE